MFIGFKIDLLNSSIMIMKQLAPHLSVITSVRLPCKISWTVWEIHPQSQYPLSMGLASSP